MEKIEMGTPDGAVENIEKIAELFPQVMTEVENADGELERAVDFDALRDLLGDVTEGQRERYQFTWPGKREAKAEARRPIYKTMIPEPGKSKDWDTTENLYIEGDNLDALKILKETYAGKVKLIYIDPPYNTGHDFVYDDDFAQTRGEYDSESGEYDEKGGRLVANTESNGRFHSDWCSMIYPRLLLARDLLTPDGLVFISINACEEVNLVKICDEIFGPDNRVMDFVWKNKYGLGALTKGAASLHEYVLCYAKKYPDNLEAELSGSEIEKYNKFDSKQAIRGGYITQPLATKSKDDRPNLVYPLVHNGIEIWPDKQWIWSKERLLKAYDNDEIVINEKNGKYSVRFKQYLRDENGVMRKGKPLSLITSCFNQDGTKEIDGLFGKRVFDFPKPSRLIRDFVLYRINDIDDSDFIVMDFFSGSAATADAVMQANSIDGGNRKFILVQIPEQCDEKTVAAKEGYRTICEIGEARIRRAGEKIRAEIDDSNRQLELGAEPKPYPDFGFRVLRIDSSNFKDFYLTPDETAQESLFDFADNVKEGRSDLDLLFEVLPKLGIPYSAKIEERVLAGKKVFFVDGDKLAACFDANVGSDTIEEMAKAKPWYAVIRDSSMADDATHANYEELFRTYSPDTIPQVI